MSLYRKDDSDTNKTKVTTLHSIAATKPSGTNVIFVDNTEAGLSENKERGLNAPGWWSYKTYQDVDGNTRHKAEHLVYIVNPEANADETQADDTAAADIASAIAITVQPTAQTAADGAATFTVTATTTSGTLTYQWQVQAASSTTRWANISAATSDTLALTGLIAGDSGKKYRVKVNNTAGGEEKVSTGATLTV